MSRLYHIGSYACENATDTQMLSSHCPKFLLGLLRVSIHVCSGWPHSFPRAASWSAYLSFTFFSLESISPPFAPSFTKMEKVKTSLETAMSSDNEVTSLAEDPKSLSQGSHNQHSFNGTTPPISIDMDSNSSRTNNTVMPLVEGPMDLDNNNKDCHVEHESKNNSPANSKIQRPS